MKSTRAKKQLSQEAMGEELGLSGRFWRHRESGDKPIERWLAYAIIGWLHVHFGSRKKSR